MLPCGGGGRIKCCSPCILEDGPVRKGGDSALERERGENAADEVGKSTAKI